MFGCRWPFRASTWSLDPQPYRVAEGGIVNGRTPVVQTGKYGENLGDW